MLWSSFYRKMHSTFEEWKQARRGNASSPRSPPSASGRRPPSLTSRVVTPLPTEGQASDGVMSFNQMRRTESTRRHRPPSEVGSVRSLQSVLTVEEQVDALDAKISNTAADVADLRRQSEQTQKLLAAILEEMKKVSSTATSKGDESKKDRASSSYSRP